jgi:hypothetical protein
VGGWAGPLTCCSTWIACARVAQPPPVARPCRTMPSHAATRSPALPSLPAAPPSTLPAPHARHCSPVLSGLPQWPRAPSLVRCACSAAPLRLSGLQTLSATRRPWVQRCVNGRLGSVTMRVGHLSSHSSAGWAGREWRESHLLHARVGAQLGRHKRDHVSMVGIPTASSTLTVVASTPGRLRTHGIL